MMHWRLYRKAYNSFFFGIAISKQDRFALVTLKKCKCEAFMEKRQSYYEKYDRFLHKEIWF